MEITILKDILRDALDTVGHVSNLRANLPILGNFLLQAEGNSVILRATDLELGYQVTLPAKVSQKGVIALPIKTLSQFIQNYTDEFITLKTKETGVLVEGGKVLSNILSADAKEFPIIPETKRETYLKVRREPLFDALRKALVCLKTTSIRADLNVVLFRVESNELTIASTDAFRLVEVKLAEFESNAKGKSYLVPRRIVQELVSLKTDAEEVTLYFDENQVECKAGDAYLITRLADYVYPQYEAVIPKEHALSVTVARSELKKCFQIAKVFASRINDATFYFSKDNASTCDVRAKNENAGEVTVTVNVEAAPKPEEAAEYSFDVNLFAELLETLDTEQIRLLFPKNNLDQKKPLVIKNTDREDFLALLVQLSV